MSVNALLKRNIPKNSHDYDHKWNFIKQYPGTVISCNHYLWGALSSEPISHAITTPALKSLKFGIKCACLRWFYYVIEKFQRCFQILFMHTALNMTLWYLEFLLEESCTSSWLLMTFLGVHKVWWIKMWSKHAFFIFLNY